MRSRNHPGSGIQHLRLAEHQHILVCDEVRGDAFGAGAAYRHQSEHAGSVHNLLVADGGEHRRAPLHRDQPDLAGDGEQFARQVD